MVGSSGKGGRLGASLVVGMVGDGIGGVEETFKDVATGGGKDDSAAGVAST